MRPWMSPAATIGPALDPRYSCATCTRSYCSLRFHVLDAHPEMERGAVTCKWWTKEQNAKDLVRDEGEEGIL